MISGKVYALKTPISAWKNFRIKYEKDKRKKFNRFIVKYEKKLRTWKKQLKRKLNDPLPKKYWHKQRPNAENRLFPYKNTGRMRNSIREGIKRHLTNKGNLVIKSWVEIATPYPAYTNEGRPHRLDGSKIGWEGWVDDVIFNYGAKRGIISVSDIFKEMTYDRKLF